MEKKYYVYVYIDPRNFEEFYYGKGTGDRKHSHLKEKGDSEKIKRIKKIQEAGKEPIIKTIAKGLTQHDALLIEKTLIWKLGKNLTNQSTGHFAENFRKHNTFHLELPGFDYSNGFYYVNVGDKKDNHSWDDCRKYSFLAAGGDKKYSDPLRKLVPGDVVVAYLRKYHYVGIGIVKNRAVKIDDFRYDGKSLHDLPLKCTMIFENHENEKTEYCLKVEWIKTVSGVNGKWIKNGGLFSSEHIVASLYNQPKTIEFLEKEFDIKFSELQKNTHFL